MAAGTLDDLTPGSPAAADPEVDGAPIAAKGDVLALFAVLWAIANLFHVWGPSGRAFDVFSDPGATSMSHVVVGVVAVVLLARPRSVAALTTLAVLGPLVAWLEAPVLGSHWVVVSLVDVALVLAVLATAPWRTAWRVDRTRLEAVFVPAARWVLLGFYAFAAFSKLNSAFFSPSVSCGTFYTDELLGSLHIGVDTMRDTWWTHLIPAGVAAIELSIPVLLVWRRTRYAGVLLGLVFHGLIALDQAHLFSDFSSVLDALFTLFLPAAFATSVVATYRSLGTPVRDRVRAVVVGGAALLLLLQWFDRRASIDRLFHDGRAWAWVICDVVLIALVVRFLTHPHPAPERRILALWDLDVPRLMLVPIGLTLVCALAPYLELRTAYAFNMYANLHTADGVSNHFVIRRTLPLTDYQKDPVQIVASSDPSLDVYASTRFDIPILQLRDYLSRHPQVALTYRWRGVTRSVAHASDDPALVEPVPAWQSKLFAFRSLDETSPQRCQPTFYSAL